MAQPRTYVGKAITIKQPWASAIAFGGRDIENRDWITHIRGRIAIHAGLGFDRDGLDDLVAGRRGGRERTVLEWINQGHAQDGLPPVPDGGQLIGGHIRNLQ